MKDLIMKNISKRLLIIFSYGILLTACSGGGDGTAIPNNTLTSPQKSTTINAIEIDINSILPDGYLTTFGPNIYIDGQRSNPGSYNLFILKGLNSNTGFFYNMINSPMPFNPDNFVNSHSQKNIVFSSFVPSTKKAKKTDDSAWIAYDFKLQESGNFIAKWMVATFTNDPNCHLLTTKAYKVGESAVSGFLELKNGDLHSDLIFSKFSPIESPSQSISITGNFMTKCSVESEDITHNIISAIDTASNIDNIKNNHYVAAGTEGGEICIYGLPEALNSNWRSLTGIAIQSGSYQKNFIRSIQFKSAGENLYSYWTSTEINDCEYSSVVNILRAKINTRTTEIEFTNLFDNTKYKNVPNRNFLDFRSSFVDEQNNVFIGNSDRLNPTPTPAKVYVLIAGSDSWQEINLSKDNDDYGGVVSVSLAADGITPIIGTKSQSSVKFQYDRIYYLSIKTN
jgi:hypothetical protein